MLELRSRGLRVGTLEDIETRGRRTLVRVDINVPMKGGRVIDDSRIKAHAATLRLLAESGALVAVIAHQGRPGGEDFETLEAHARALEAATGLPVTYVPDIIGPAAAEAVKALEPGELLLLENTRFLAEDNIEGPPELLLRTHLVRRLSRLFEVYVGDAFATAHRAQPSVAGLPLAMPAVAGKVMESELRAAEKLLSANTSYFVGGSKLNDVAKVAPGLASKGVIMTGGLSALLFAKAMGQDLGRAEEALRKVVGPEALELARAAVSKGKVLVPLDYVVEEKGEIKVVSANELSTQPKDVGPATVEAYRDVMESSGAVLFKGTAGIVEDPRFRRGTVALLEAALSSGAFVIVGGGHVGASLAWVRDELRSMVGYVSTAGGALLYMAAGLPLPGVEALAESYRKFLGGTA